MSDDEEKKKKKASRPHGKKKLTGEPFKVVRHIGASKPSTEQTRQIYMASPFLEWTPFAKSQKWHPIDSRKDLPIMDWIQEKRDILAREQAEEIGDLVFSHKGRWHHDVLKTLKEYPEANDAMLGILKKRLNDIIGMIKQDGRDEVLNSQEGKAHTSQFSRLDTRDLTALAMAIKICTESKHKSLMINDWNFKVAETFSDPKQFSTEEQKVADMAWEVHILGGENITHKDMGDFLGRYYDRPALPHTLDSRDKKAAGDA